jgi:hypothetical protein
VRARVGEAGGKILGPDHVFPGGRRFHFLGASRTVASVVDASCIADASALASAVRHAGSGSVIRTRACLATCRCPSTATACPRSSPPRSSC